MRKKQKIDLPAHFNRSARCSISILMSRPDFVSVGDAKSSNARLFNFRKYTCLIDCFGAVKWRDKNGDDCKTPKVFGV